MGIRQQLRSQGPVSVHAHLNKGVTGSKGREGKTGSGAGAELGVGTERGRGQGLANKQMMGSGTGAGTGTRTGSGRVEERRRSARNRISALDENSETVEP